MYSQGKGTQFGWYQESSGNASLDEYTQNGKFCISGLAFPVNDKMAQCTETNRILFDGQETNNPYNCTATDPDKKCQIIYEEDDPANKGSVDVFCRCSMSDSTSGFCESVIGTETYAKAVRAKKLLYRESKCHTLDRENMRAQRDDCGIGDFTDEWRFAVDQQFNVTHWPYIQDNQIYHCVQKFFADSYINESLDHAENWLVYSMTTIVAASLSQLLF